MTLDHPPCEILRKALTNLGLGSFPPAEPWPIWAGNEGDRPDDAITIRDTTGRSDGRSMIDGELFEHNGFQVRIRSADERDGWAKATAIREALAKTVYETAVTIAEGQGDGEDYLIHCISRIGQILFIGKESSQSSRTLHTLNAMMSVKQLQP